MASESITVSNYTKLPIQIITVQDVDDHSQKIHTINPKDTYVIFIDRVESVQWTKPDTIKADGSVESRSVK